MEIESCRKTERQSGKEEIVRRRGRNTNSDRKTERQTGRDTENSRDECIS